MTSLLIFLMVKTRPNIVFSIIIITYFAKNLSYTYIEIVKTIFSYLKKSID